MTPVPPSDVPLAGATAVSVGALRHGFGRIIFAGLLLSMSGDMFMIGQTQRHFLFGLASFLLAHIAYITAFFVHGIKGKWAAVAAIPVLIVTYFVILHERKQRIATGLGRASRICNGDAD